MNISVQSRRWALSLLATALLAACGGGGGGPDGAHDSVSIATAGRLAMAEQGSKTLRLHDLDSASAAVEASYTLDNEPSAVYASPGGRYALAVQRLQDQVQIIDGGIWQEDHGDHLHDYKQASRAVAWKITGPRPTHYDVQAGKQAAFFMDGNATASPVQNAGVRLFTDASIARASLVASTDLNVPIHGLAEPRDDKLLLVSRAADAPDTLPTHLNLHLRNGSGYSFSRQLATRCDGMHGSFSSGAYTVTGCLDGMLLVRHTAANAVDDGRKLTTRLRVGTVAGHASLPGHFIGIATEGTAPAPVTTRFYAVDAERASVTDLVPQGWETGRQRRAHAFDRSGQRFFVLDDQGTLVVMQRQNDGWVPLARIAGAIPVMPSAAPWPTLVANGAVNELYLTDPVARQLVMLDSSTGAVKARRNLGYVPSTAAWLGITR
ncbi:MAG: hypothetical protein ACK40S_00765 [Burkholderiaceae bacterium]